MIAIEHVLAHIGKAAYATAGVTHEMLSVQRIRTRESLLRETWTGIDPAMADHASAEIADRVDEHLSRIETLLREMDQRLAPREG